jgi:hypothetical protein
MTKIHNKKKIIKIQKIEEGKGKNQIRWMAVRFSLDLCVCGCVKDGSSNQVESLIEEEEEGRGNNPSLYLGRRPAEEEEEEEARSQ